MTLNAIVLETSLPPSSNNMYVLVKRGRKTYHVPSVELQKYKRDVAEMRYSLGDYVNQRETIHQWLLEYKTLCIRVQFYFERSRIWTKAGRPKKNDVSNRIKATHDAVADLFDIDDCVFFKVSADKMDAQLNNGVEAARITIWPLGGING